MSVEAVRARIAEVLGVSPADIADEDNLLDHGLDSMRVMSLVEGFQSAGVEVSFADLAEHPTVARWAALVSPR